MSLILRRRLRSGFPQQAGYFRNFSSEQFKPEVLSTSSQVPDEIVIYGHKYKKDDWTTVTDRVLNNLVGRQLHENLNNPIGIVSEGIRRYFKDYQLFRFPSPVVTTYQNFDSLLVPEGHVSRNKHDSYYINKKFLLRAHTSAHQENCLRSGANKIACIADVFRRDEVDRTHFPAFHQCELIRLFTPSDLNLSNEQTFVPFSNTSKPRTRTPTCQESYTAEASELVVSHMKKTIEEYIRYLLPPETLQQEELRMRWVDAYFPFTHPSFELEIFFNDKWLEILGAGVVEQVILDMSGRHSNSDSSLSCLGWAAGFGIERLAMLRYNIQDIRLFWAKHPKFLSQFKGKEPDDIFHYKEDYHPPVMLDISFWLPEKYQKSQDTWSDNDFYDIVHTYGESMVQEVTCYDSYTNPKTKKAARSYRVKYQCVERDLTKPQAWAIHMRISRYAKLHLGVELR